MKIDYNVKHFDFLGLEIGWCLKTAINGETKVGFLNMLRNHLLVIGGRTNFVGLLLNNGFPSVYDGEYTYIDHQHACVS